MKKTYTRKQIQEAINYWKKRLDEAIEPQPADARSYVFDEKLEHYGNFRAYVRSIENDKSVLYFSWYQKPKYAGAGRYVKSSVFKCVRVSHANGGADEWICDIARDKSLAEVQRLYEKIRAAVENDAPADERDLIKSVRKAVAALGLNTRQSEWYERVGTDHGLDEGEDDLPGDFDKEELFIDLKDRATSDPDALGRLEAAYRALEPGWDGDMNDDDYVDWEYDFLHRALAAAVRIGSGAGTALALMKPALDRVAETGDDGNCFG